MSDDTTQVLLSHMDGVRDEMVRALDHLALKVGVQNGRIGKIEMDRIAERAVADAAKKRSSWRFPAVVTISGAIVSGVVLYLLAALIG